MSDTPPSDPKTRATPNPQAGAAPEPFVRGRIVWGRPPETVFRAGPLPRAPQSWAETRPQPTVAAPSPATNIFTGSMIPRAAPIAEPEPLPGETPLAPEPEIDTVVEAPPAPSTAKPRRARKAAAPAEPASTAPVETPVEAPIVEAYVEPEPVAEPVVATVVSPEPVRPAAAPRPKVEIIVEPEATEQIDTAPPPLSGASTGPADPRSIPSVVVTPTLYARVEAVMETVKANDTWRIAAVAGAVVVIGGFIWLATLPSGDAPALDMDAPPPAAPGAEALTIAPPAATPTASVPASEALPPVVAQPETAPVRSEPAPAVRPAPARRAPSSPAPAPTPRIAEPPVEAAPPPVIETAPLVIEPPTSATPAPSDPDAPIETRPQPLN